MALRCHYLLSRRIATQVYYSNDGRAMAANLCTSHLRVTMPTPKHNEAQKKQIADIRRRYPGWDIDSFLVQ